LSAERQRRRRSKCLASLVQFCVCSFGDAALPDPPAPAGVVVRIVGAFPASVDPLWRRCLPAVPCAVRRDHRHLDWRWVQNHAHADYVRVVASVSGEPTGLLVLRPHHELIPGAAAIVDWVCHDDDAATAQRRGSEACRLTIRITGPHTTPELLAEHWRYTLGDTDLCRCRPPPPLPGPA
jgi:hypothetical protein